MYIDINCDMGEGILTGAGGKDSADEAIMPYISSANIACGLHAGDPAGIMKTIDLALRYGVRIGAHPGFPDREGFGRMPVEMTNEALRASLLYQVGAVKSMAEALGGSLQHVKPHGALYNKAAADERLATTIARAARDIDATLMLTGPPGSALEHAARLNGLGFAAEMFADRAYNDDGSLVARGQPGAVLTDIMEMVERLIVMLKKQTLTTINGKPLHLRADTVCVHGDNPAAPEFVKAIREVCSREGIGIRAMSIK